MNSGMLPSLACRQGPCRRHSALGRVALISMVALIVVAKLNHLNFVSSFFPLAERSVGSVHRTRIGSTSMPKCRRSSMTLRAKKEKTFAVGDLVTAVSPEDNTRYSGVVGKMNKDGTIEVKWDDPDGGAESHPCEAKSVKCNRPKTAADFTVGDLVMAVSPEDDQTYSGVVDAINKKDGTVQVKWDDPDGGAESHACNPETMETYIPKTPLSELKIGDRLPGIVTGSRDFGVFIDINAEAQGLCHKSAIPKPVVKTGAFAVGDIVEAVFPEDEEWYTAVVVGKPTKTKISVKWDDPDGGPEESSVKPDQIRHYAAPLAFVEGQEVEVSITRINDGKIQLSMLEPPDYSAYLSLHPDERLKATIVTVVPFGFFVEVENPKGGAPQRGLVHKSQIKPDFVTDTNEEGAVGDEISVRVVDVNEVSQKLSLSMLQPGQMAVSQRPVVDMSQFANFPSNEWLKGRVVKVMPFGAFVEISLPDDGPTAQGLVHITNLRDGFVSSVAEEVQEGQEVDCWILEVNLQMNRISLSMKGGDGGGASEYSGGGGGGARQPVDYAPFDAFPSDQWLKGSVVKVSDFGAFVSVTLPDGGPTASGLVHKSQLSDTFVESVADVVSVGQEVDVWIRQVDLDAGKMSLSMVTGADAE